MCTEFQFDKLKRVLGWMVVMEHNIIKIFTKSELYTLKWL